MRGHPEGGVPLGGQPERGEWAIWGAVIPPAPPCTRWRATHAVSGLGSGRVPNGMHWEWAVMTDERGSTEVGGHGDTRVEPTPVRPCAAGVRRSAVSVTVPPRLMVVKALRFLP